MLKPMTVVKQDTVTGQRGNGDFSPKRLHQASLNGGNSLKKKPLEEVQEAHSGQIEVCSKPQIYKVWGVRGTLALAMV